MDNHLNWNDIYDRIFSVYPIRTQQELGKELGVSQDLISNWKTGKAIPTWHVLEKIVQDKHLTWEWLLTGKRTSLRDGGTIYDRIKNRLMYKYGNEITDSQIAEMLNVSADTVASWSDGTSRPDFETLKTVDKLTGFGVDYFITGFLYNIYEEEITKEKYDIIPIYNGNINHGFRAPFPHSPLNYIDDDDELFDLPPHIQAQIERSRPKSVPVKHYFTEWPVRGCAAADDSGGSRIPDTDDFDDPIDPPAGLTAVPVQGDSMSPVLLAGQYALIDKEREGFEEDGGIVVAAIRENDAADPRHEQMTGTFVKRCHRRGDHYFFSSVNSYPPFSAYSDHCRIWPVIGVWFGGKGKPPKS